MSGEELLQLNRIRAKREDYIRSSQENNISLETLLTELYPDDAHFVYELLQNAEDAQASTVKFILQTDQLIVEHDGKRLFTIQDVESITNVAISTKRDDITKIGKFGVGFKAVFAYTESPRIYSGAFSFEIKDLLVPIPLQTLDVGYKTRFEFPFNHSKKTSKQAYEEIKSRLIGLKHTTLLFLNHIKKISWQIDGNQHDYIQRIDINEDVFQLVSQQKTECWLRFVKQTVEGYKIAVAFELKKKNQNEPILNKLNDLSDVFEVVPSENAPISVYFPTEQISGLQFHIHAPFKATVARDNITSFDGNHRLMAEIGELVVEKLETIKNLGMLTGRFLAVLPNKDDKFPEEKGVSLIKDAIWKAFETEELLPTDYYTFCHKRLAVNGTAELRKLLTKEDLAFSSDKIYTEWVVKVPYQSRSKLFLDTIGVSTLTTKFIWDAVLKKFRDNSNSAENLVWLANKPVDWLQEFYLLLDEVATAEKSAYSWSSYNYNRLSSCYIIPTKDLNNWGKPENVYFLPESNVPYEGFYYLNSGLLEGDPEQVERLRKFFKAIGVKNVDEAEIIKLLIAKHYSGINSSQIEMSIEAHIGHVKQFIRYYQTLTSKNNLFEDYVVDVLKQGFIALAHNGTCHKPSDLFIDNPYQNTGLLEVYLLVPPSVRKNRISDLYKQWLIEQELDSWLNLLNKLGCHSKLAFMKLSVQKYNNHLLENFSGKGARRTENKIDEDYTIRGLTNLLEARSERVSMLIWNRMSNLNNDNFFKARYSPNGSFNPVSCDSYLIQELRKQAWIPSIDGEFYKPSKISRNLLPPNFTITSKTDWLKRIGFGEEDVRGKNIDLLSDSLGIEKDILDRISSMSVSEQRLMMQQWSEQKNTKKQKDQLPLASVADPAGRMVQAQKVARSAPYQSTELRARTVRTTGDKNAAKAYLRTCNTNNAGKVICQMCDTAMPFQVNEKDYFEAVEFIDRAREYDANHLALCPNCAAEFMHAGADKEIELLEKVNDLNENDTESSLRIDIKTPVHSSIRFTQKHLIDLKAALEVG